MFQGAEHYITPSWYATKRETGKVVPTWNYRDGAGAGPAARDRGRRLAARADRGAHAQARGRPRAPWAVGDAPEDFVAAQIRAIVGVEIEIADIKGKWKASQNRNDGRPRRA